MATGANGPMAVGMVSGFGSATGAGAGSSSIGSRIDWMVCAGGAPATALGADGAAFGADGAAFGADGADGGAFGADGADFGADGGAFGMDGDVEMRGAEGGGGGGFGALLAPAFTTSAISSMCERSSTAETEVISSAFAATDAPPFPSSPLSSTPLAYQRGRGLLRYFFSSSVTSWISAGDSERKRGGGILRNTSSGSVRR